MKKVSTLIYDVIRETPDSNRIVKELNASVLSATFKNTSGQHFADLYTCPNSADCLVAHGSCGPVNGTFVKTVEINFGS